MTGGIKKSLGLLGGTFDPVHNGHLRAAIELKEALSLDTVLLIPCRPSHRLQDQVGDHHRLAMLEQALGFLQGVVLDDREIRRGQPSYTVDTLRELRLEFGNDTDIYLAMGQDAFADFSSWKEPEAIMSLARLVVLCRPGNGQLRQASANETVIYLENPVMDISSSQIRQRLRQGRSVRYLVPETVEHYIYQHRLYA